jgi:hypothetical protein
MFARTSPAIIAVFAISVFGCGSDGSGGDQNGSQNDFQCVVVGESGDNIDCAAVAEVRDVSSLPVSAGSVVKVPVGNVATGQHIDLKFSIFNTANKTTAALLKIKEIGIVGYEAASATEAEKGAAFECLDATGAVPCSQKNGTWPAVVPAGVGNSGGTDKLDFTIRYKRYDDVPRVANVLIKMAGDPKVSGGQYLIRFGTDLGQPNIQLTPGELAFDQVKPNEEDSKQFSITNTGDALLEVRSFAFAADSGFTLIGNDKKEHQPNGPPIKFDPPISVDPNKSANFSIKFKAKDDKQRQGSVTIETNDPTPGKNNKLVITANAHLPCMKLEPTGKLNFGGIKLGEPTEREVKINNCGGVDLIVEKINFGDLTNSDEYSLDYKVTAAKYADVDPKKGPTKDKPLVIKVNGNAPFTVIYTPSDESPIDQATNEPKPDIAEVVVHSNAFSAKNTVICEGIGVKKTCPTAKIIVKEGEEVIPQTMLHLKGDQSKATGGGTIKSYKWKVKQPAGSNQVFVPGPTFPNPTFTANAAGEYEFCLEVTDQNDKKSCAPACVTVLVLPEEAIHVELLWKTPADPDETDTGPAAGADMDLHFAHPLASGPDIDCDKKPDPWFSNPFDTFWFNPNPNWGSANPQVNDDPSLDLDDTDGAGPENLNLDDPEGKVGKPVQYAVGVHYWNDHGFQTSYATVNIYIMGVLALQISKVKMNVLDMWYVGKINWPNTMSQGVLDPFQICYQNGDPCSGGKRWLPKGEYCITPCYVNPAFTATQSGANPTLCKKKKP